MLLSLCTLTVLDLAYAPLSAAFCDVAQCQCTIAAARAQLLELQSELELVRLMRWRSDSCSIVMQVASPLSLLLD